MSSLIYRISIFCCHCVSSIYSAFSRCQAKLLKFIYFWNKVFTDLVSSLIFGIWEQSHTFCTHIYIHKHTHTLISILQVVSVMKARSVTISWMSWRTLTMTRTTTGCTSSPRRRLVWPTTTASRSSRPWPSSGTGSLCCTRVSFGMMDLIDTKRTWSLTLFLSMIQ